jgi:hypothetical protein
LPISINGSSDNLDNLLKYYKKEILDSKYYQLVKSFLVLRTLLEEVKEHGIEIDVPYVSITKVLDKIECNVTTKRFL